MQVGALLDDRQLFDDRLRREQISKAQPRREHFRKAAQVDHHRLRVQRMERRRRRRRREVEPPVHVVLDDRHAQAGRERQQIAPHANRHRPAGRVVERGVGVNQLGAVAQEMIFELVDVVPHDVPADEPRAGRAERLDRADVSGTIDNDRVAGIDEAAGEQIEPLLRAGQHQHGCPAGSRSAGQSPRAGPAAPRSRRAPRSPIRRAEGPCRTSAGTRRQGSGRRPGCPRTMK